MGDRMQLRGMWQFPATWSGLKFLSRFIKMSVPQPYDLEEAILNSTSHPAIIADLHGRLLGLAAGQSSLKKWMSAVTRFIRKNPLAFEHVFSSTDPSGEDSTAIDSSDKSQFEDDTAFNEQEEKILARFPKYLEIYDELPAITRLHLLHTIVDMVISETELSPATGNLKDRDIEDLPFKPIGNDALGNSYWYFDDQERVYREPGRKSEEILKMKKEEALKAKREEEKRIAKEERERKKREEQEKKEKIRLAREERKRKKMERWAPRVSSTRTTRASKRAQTNTVASSSNPTEPNPSTNEADMENGKVLTSRRSTNQKENDVITEKNDISTGRRTSGRKRKPTVIESPNGVNQSQPSKRSRTSDLTDLELSIRQCNQWEVVSTSAAGLREFLSKMKGEDENIRASERTLIRTLEEKVLPHIEEFESKSRRETERKVQTDFLLANQKRSSRVQAIAQRREEEAKQRAEEERQAREKEEEVNRHELEVKAQVSSYRMEQSRDIREARRLHGKQEMVDRDQMEVDNLNKREEIKSRTRMSQSIRRSMRSQRRNPKFYGESNDITEDDEAAIDGEARDEQEAFNSPKEQAEDTEAPSSVDISEQDNRKESLRELEPKNEPISDSSATLKDPTQFSYATVEKDIPERFTWVKNKDDNLPTRVLENFFFAVRTDFADAPLELCDDESVKIVGFGILIPPPSSSPIAIRVEIPKILEWVIEYGPEPILWVRSETAWYQLKYAAAEYKQAFSTAKRKFELSARVYLIGDQMRGSHLSYESIVNYLSFEYEDMAAYTESDILLEKRFICYQMESLGKKTLLHSGFIRNLQNKIRQEDRNALAKIKKEQSLKSTPTSSPNTQLKKHREIHKKTPSNRNRSKTTITRIGTRPVPPAVSSIISAILQNATKSRQQHAKKNRKKTKKANGELEKTAKSSSIPNGSSSNAPKMKPVMSNGIETNNTKIQNGATKDTTSDGGNKLPVNLEEKPNGIAKKSPNQAQGNATEGKTPEGSQATTNLYISNNTNLETSKVPSS